jgi:hypothetical protein
MIHSRVVKASALTSADLLSVPHIVNTDFVGPRVMPPIFEASSVPIMTALRSGALAPTTSLSQLVLMDPDRALVTAAALVASHGSFSAVSSQTAPTHKRKRRFTASCYSATVPSTSLLPSHWGPRPLHKTTPSMWSRVCYGSGVYPEVASLFEANHSNLDEGSGASESAPIENVTPCFNLPLQASGVGSDSWFVPIFLDVKLVGPTVEHRFIGEYFRRGRGERSS